MLDAGIRRWMANGVACSGDDSNRYPSLSASVACRPLPAVAGMRYALSVAVAASVALAACDGDFPHGERGDRSHSPPEEALVPLFGDESSASVVVSLSFDDGFLSQSSFFDILKDNDIDTVFGSFFINSSRLNLEINERESRDHVRYASLDVWAAAAEQGHEIGSHTVSHPDLTCTQERFAQGVCQTGHEPIDPDEVRRQICGDREMLNALGFGVMGFAYPFGRNATDDGAASLNDTVALCGFSYARATSGLRRGRSDDSLFPLAESFPPENSFAVRSYQSLSAEIGFEDIKEWILDARDAGGGWVPLLMHHISDDCADPEDAEAVLGVCTRRDELEHLVRWLARKNLDEGESGAPQDVVTRTLGQVMQEVGTLRRHEVANGSLEERHSGSIDRPNCFDRFQGRHEENFEWSSAEVEGSRVAAGQWGDPAAADGHFEKLIPTESHPAPLVQMTTRDDSCYLPVAAGRYYQVRLRARARESSDVPAEGRFQFRTLSVPQVDGSSEPTWQDWSLASQTTQLLGADWQEQRLDLPPVPEGVIALAIGYQYLAPAPDLASSQEIWVDDFELFEFP